MVPQYRSVLFYVLGWSVMLVGGRDLLSFLFLIWLEGVVVKWSSMEELFFFLVGLYLRNGRKAVDEDSLFFGLDRQ